MYTKEFGEVEVVWGEYPKGVLIRQTEEVILLEEHFDDQNENVDVLHRFPEDMRLFDKGDVRECLAKAREYEPDFNVPIHIMRLTEPQPENPEEKRANYMSIIEHSARCPWNPIPARK